MWQGLLETENHIIYVNLFFLYLDLHLFHICPSQLLFIAILFLEPLSLFRFSLCSNQTGDK